MALTKNIEVTLTIRPTGHIEILRQTIVLDDDGSELGRRNHRDVIAPDEDVSTQPALIRRIANAIRN